jgi:imidazolonepropionase-like amidohydrolase
VVVAGGRISEVGSNPTPQGTVIDYGGATILPGLIDAHCHITLTGDGKNYQEQMLDPDEMMSLIAVHNMKRHLESGVTTVRDNGGRNRVVFVVREAILRGYITGPRLLLSGRPVTHTGGHFNFCNGVADSEADIRAAVRLLVAEGADHIKIMASGGATLGNIPYYASYTAAEMRWAVEAAHALGRPTTAHCRATQSMLNAVEAGSDCIEHAEYLVPGEMTQFGGGVASGGRMVYDSAVTDRLLDAGTFISATLQAGGYETLVDLRTKRARGDRLSDAEAQRAQALEDYFDMKLEVFAGLLRDGMKPQVVISSDSGPFDVSFGRLQYGLELAVTGGMSAMEAIDATTRVAAEVCGVSDEVGCLKAGMLADMIVIDGDPLTNISDLWRVRQVYSRGHPVIAQPAEYSAMSQGVGLV